MGISFYFSMNLDTIGIENIDDIIKKNENNGEIISPIY